MPTRRRRRHRHRRVVLEDFCWYRSSARNAADPVHFIRIVHEVYAAATVAALLRRRDELKCGPRSRPSPTRRSFFVCDSLPSSRQHSPRPPPHRHDTVRSAAHHAPCNVIYYFNGLFVFSRFHTGKQAGRQQGRQNKNERKKTTTRNEAIKAMNFVKTWRVYVFLLYAP